MTQLTIDYSRDELLTPLAKATLNDRYLAEGERSPQEAFARAALATADDVAHAQRLYDYVSKQWFMFSTPILSNAGTKRGLPISCFLGYTPDSIEGLVSTWTENAYLTVGGGGIGNYYGHVRSDGEGTSRGTKSTGVIGHIKTIETQMLAYSQGSNRRGAAAIYLDVSHPEIEEFITIRKVGGGDTNRKCLARSVFHHAVNVPDSFMEAVREGHEWHLIDPHSKDIRKTVDARELWAKILEVRHETGEPYIHFIDASNRALPQALKDKGKKVYQSNLCSEVILPTDKDSTAVCCLSSVNLEKYDEWKDHPMFIEDLIRMLDNVLTMFIAKAHPIHYRRAIKSAMSERSVGLGAMGFHGWLQKKYVPFESAIAKSWNVKMFKQIWEQADVASRKLATERGEAPDMEGTGRRNALLIAVAPNASSGIIAGTSAGIEPEPANIYVRKTDSGSYTVRNPHLAKIIEDFFPEKADQDDIWKSILANEGSVAHLDFLTPTQKDIFKTAWEINPLWFIEHAADRQPYIDQAQSLNLFLPSNVDKKTLNSVHWEAWKRGLKTLYYLRSTAAQRVDNIGQKIKRQVIEENGSCLACES